MKRPDRFFAPGVVVRCSRPPLWRRLAHRLPRPWPLLALCVAVLAGGAALGLSLLGAAW